MWSRVVRSAGGTTPILRAVLVNSSLDKVDGDTAVVICPQRYIAGGRKNIEPIQKAFSLELGRSVLVEFRLPDGEVEREAASADAGASEAHAGAPDGVHAPATTFNPNLAVEHELVKQAMELFGARVVDVRPR